MVIEWLYDIQIAILLVEKNENKRNKLRCSYAKRKKPNLLNANHISVRGKATIRSIIASEYRAYLYQARQVILLIMISTTEDEAAKTWDMFKIKYHLSLSSQRNSSEIQAAYQKYRDEL